MKKRWRMFSDEVVRLYHSIFEDRSIPTIQEDYYSNKWISKSEIIKIFEFEKSALLFRYKEAQQDLNDLKESFNLNALANYQRLERKEQGKISEQARPKDQLKVRSARTK